MAVVVDRVQAGRRSPVITDDIDEPIVEWHGGVDLG